MKRFPKKGYTRRRISPGRRRRHASNAFRITTRRALAGV